MNQKDKDAIAHIASVSKHPHAAMIVEWLITGCDVEYYEDSDREWYAVPNSEIMTWYLDAQYRLVKPNSSGMRKNAGLKSKEEMRRALESGVVLFRGCDTKYYFSEERIFEGKSPYVVEYLRTGEICSLSGMWSHYKLMEIETTWPTELVERIAAIDIDAANWIVENWDDLDDDKYRSGGCHNKTSDALLRMFDWSESPQGGDYWCGISNELGE